MDAMEKEEAFQRMAAFVREIAAHGECVNCGKDGEEDNPECSDHKARDMHTDAYEAARMGIENARGLLAQFPHLADVERCTLIVTTGGTGPNPRDVTPEATEAVCDRLMPGFGELMRARSLLEVPTAILSRQIAGTRGSSLIINLPGKPAAIRTCLDAVFAAAPYCIDLIGGARLETNPRYCQAFRPKA